MKELLEIQSAVNVPKNSYNDFGKYNYRSCESILEAIKPVLKSCGCVVLLSDELVNIGDRYYVKATATIRNADGESDSVTAYAREANTKKGCDEAQITGAASSYARKYALSGLLALDDNKDPDTNEFKKVVDKSAQVQEEEERKEAIKATHSGVKQFAESSEHTVEDITKLLLQTIKADCNSIEELDSMQLKKAIKQLTVWQKKYDEISKENK